jgi:hypothetical protein
MSSIRDRAFEAFRPDNTIEAVSEPTRNPAADAASPPSPNTGEPHGPNKKSPAYRSEPPSIANTYYVEDKGRERQYFEDYKKTNLVMRANETSVMSRREDLVTIRAMLEIAEARGWHSVEIKGSAEFRREAWIEANARGLEGRGFTPSDADRQEADRRREGRQQANQIRAAEKQEAREDLATGKPAAAAEHEKKAEARQPGEPERPTVNDGRRAIREAQRDLSEDGRLLLAALSDKIERQMNRLNTENKTELKAFVGSELMKKERAEGPTVLSQEMKQSLKEPTRNIEPPGRRLEPEPPRRSISR